MYVYVCMYICNVLWCSPAAQCMSVFVYRCVDVYVSLETHS
jgi:hypothetical protein